MTALTILTPIFGLEGLISQKNEANYPYYHIGTLKNFPKLPYSSFTKFIKKLDFYVTMCNNIRPKAIKWPFRMGRVFGSIFCLQK
jgi:hypothetical protein